MFDADVKANREISAISELLDKQQTSRVHSIILELERSSGPAGDPLQLGNPQPALLLVQIILLQGFVFILRAAKPHLSFNLRAFLFLEGVQQLGRHSAGAHLQ